MSRTRLLLLCALFSTPIAHGASTAAPGAPSTVIASQGDISVTMADVDAFVQRIPETQRPGFFSRPERIETMILSLLLDKTLAEEARKAGLDKQPETETRVDLAVNEALSAVRLEDMKKNLKIPDFSKLAKEEYLGHKEKYGAPERVNVKHILISTKTRSKDEAKAIADDVEKQAHANPAQFDALVEKYSEDPSKTTNKGLMTDAASSRFTPAFANAAKALTKPGEISPVVESPYGYHILALVDRTPAKQVAFEEVREQIVADLRKKFVEKAIKDHTDAIRNRPMTANSELVATLRTRYGTLPQVPPAQSATPAPAGQ